jgi:PAS domain S-box-containing protein
MSDDLDVREHIARIDQRRAASIARSPPGTPVRDAIISKDLDGVITTWNRDAERLFGYTAAEAVGRPVTILIPPERIDEEPCILARIRRGEGIEHYKTVRRRKDGSLVEISLTVSPMQDATGRIVGASKIARDITERNSDDLIRPTKTHFYETRLIVARLLHDVLRSGHRGGLTELPFMHAVEILVIISAILWAEREDKLFNALSLSKHLGMPRATLFRRLSFLQSKKIVCRNADGLRLNRQVWATPVRDENIRDLRQLIIDAGAALSKVDTESHSLKTDTHAGMDESHL